MTGPFILGMYVCSVCVRVSSRERRVAMRDEDDYTCYYNMRTDTVAGLTGGIGQGKVRVLHTKDAVLFLLDYV